jgi:hypothetical protein
MDLKAEYESLEDVPEMFREIYAERDGKVVINVQGVKTQSDFDKLNEGILREREAHKKTKERFRPFLDNNVDPNEAWDRVQRFDELQEIANSKMDPSRIEELAAERVNRTKSQYEKQVADLSAELRNYQQREKVRTIQDQVRRALVDAKVVPSAQEDALMIATQVFDVGDDGKVYTKDGVGVTPGQMPEAWVREMQPKRSHWWQTSQGTGSTGSGSSVAGISNPWKKDATNLTEQMRITRENPELARQLAKAAGVDLKV